jgi:hypothetical protein
MAAAALPGGGEVVYLGMYGSANGGANLPGHILNAVINPSSSTAPTWHDLTLSPVANNGYSMNKFGMDVSTISIDLHDVTGNTAYVTIEGAMSSQEAIQTVYRTTDGGAHWTDLTANLPQTPASAILVDPQNASTVYIATDEGVYFTTQVSSCTVAQNNFTCAGGCDLRPRNLANPACVVGVSRDLGDCHPRHVCLSQPEHRDREQLPGNHSGEQRNKCSHSNLRRHERRLQRDRQLRECDRSAWF